MILSHNAALFSWGSCASQSPMSLLTAWAKVLLSFGREVRYLPGLCGQSLLTFNTPVLYFSSWRMSWRGFVFFLWQFHDLCLFFFCFSQSERFCLPRDSLFPTMWLTNLIRSRRYHCKVWQFLCWDQHMVLYAPNTLQIPQTLCTFDQNKRVY